MISPNCPLIMETTSTTSSYNTLERNPHRERMRSNLGDSNERLTENELLEEPTQDPEDEDTLSDDSLRLRLSDDEADSSQPRSKDASTLPYISSEQTTSSDTAMGVTDSDEKVPINREIKSSTNRSGEPASKEECQRSEHRNQILSETRVGGKKNINSMWRGGSRTAPSSNKTIHSPKRPLRGHSFHVRYNRHSNIHGNASYFNDQDNFGRPPGYHRYGSSWRPPKGRYLQNSTRNVRTKQCSANVKVEKPSVVAVKKLDDSLSSVNDELSKECSHLNFDKESTLDSKSCENVNSDNSERKDRKNISGCSYDSQFATDNCFNEPCDNPNKPKLCSETSTPLLSQDSSDFQGVGSTLPVQDTKSAVPSEQKNETFTSDSPVPESITLSSVHLAKDKIKSETGGNSNDAKIDTNNTDKDASNNTETDVNTNGSESEATEKLNLLDDPSASPEAHDPEVMTGELSTAVEEHSKEMEISEHRDNNIDQTKEVNAEEVSHGSCSKEDISNEENTKNTDKTESQQIDIPSSNGQEVAEQPMEVAPEDKDTVNDAENQAKKSAAPDDKRRASLESHSVKVAHDSPQELTALTFIEENIKQILVSNETSNKPSNDSESKVTKQNLSKRKSGIETQPPPLVMKRSLPDGEAATDKLNNKRMKVTPDVRPAACPKQFENSTIIGLLDEKKESMVTERSHGAPKPLQFIRKFFQRDVKGKLAKLKREELEELIIQKLVETITMRSEIGKLREQARISERNQEATRVRCQQLSKQIKDFSMVLNRNAVDRLANNDKPVPPIKINRSVGLQVNFVTEHGIQTLRALSANNAAKTNVPNPVLVNGSNAKTSEKVPHTTAIRRGLKVRSPRRADVPKSTPLPAQPQTSSATPAALVMSSKPPETSHNVSLLNNNKEHPSPSVNITQPTATKLQNILMNGKISHQVNRQATVPNNQKPESNDLIDLTEEEDKHRSASSVTSSLLPMIGTVTPSVGTKVQHPRLQRVVQGTIPANVAITTQPANIRVVQSVAQPTPTALVNNINTPRLAYLMPGTPGTGRQLLIAPNPNQIRPVTSNPRGQYSNLTYKSGISTLANGNVRVITTAAPTIPNSQPLPAPLPDTPHYQNKNGWKLPPPPPSLKISKVTQGIVLSWNMAQSENYAEIASYQLYAYQEIPGTPPNSNLWKKVGDVRALPLPMACTLKEFTPGNNYHFAVRAVDTHSRLGQYSIPRNISL